eukprot:1160487-Pyramimonas_sp.AAC.2
MLSCVYFNWKRPFWAPELSVALAVFSRPGEVVAVVIMHPGSNCVAASTSAGVLQGVFDRNPAIKYASRLARVLEGLIGGSIAVWSAQASSRPPPRKCSRVAASWSRMELNPFAIHRSLQGWNCALDVDPDSQCHGVRCV